MPTGWGRTQQLSQPTPTIHHQSHQGCCGQRDQSLLRNQQRLFWQICLCRQHYASDVACLLLLATVVDLRRLTAPYWWSSSWFWRRYSIQYPMKDSNNFPVSQSIRSVASLFLSTSVCFYRCTFGAGITLASFQRDGTTPSLTYALKIAHTGQASRVQKFCIEPNLEVPQGLVPFWYNGDQVILWTACLIFTITFGTDSFSHVSVTNRECTVSYGIIFNNTTGTNFACSPRLLAEGCEEWMSGHGLQPCVLA